MQRNKFIAEEGEISWQSVLSSHGSPLVFPEDYASFCMLNLPQASGVVEESEESHFHSAHDAPAQRSWWLCLVVYWTQNLGLSKQIRLTADSSLGQLFGLFSFSRPSERPPSDYASHLAYQRSLCILPALSVSLEGQVVWQVTQDLCYVSPSRAISPNQWTRLVLRGTSDGLFEFGCWDVEQLAWHVIPAERLERHFGSRLWFSPAALQETKTSRLLISGEGAMAQLSWWRGAVNVGLCPAAAPWVGSVSSIAFGFAPRSAPLMQVCSAAETATGTAPTFPPSFGRELQWSYTAKCLPLVSVDALLRWSDLSSRGLSAQAADAAENHPDWLHWPLEPDAPITLVCHDMRGGYLQDAVEDTFQLCDTSDVPSYTFLHWAATDVFVYFSHYRVSCPPQSWIAAAHRNGVPILGTFITEWADGASDSVLLLDNYELAATKLALLARAQGFDGYLLNFEADIPIDHLKKLERFIKALKAALKRLVGPHGLLIWYDSVSFLDGKVQWQNEVNEHNLRALMLDGSGADYLFLNYHWTSHHLQRSCRFLQENGISTSRMCVGIDIWGRGTVFGGGYRTRQAAALARLEAPGCSLALFAPAWTVEAEAPSFQQRSRWLRLLDPALWHCSTPFVEALAVGRWQASPIEDGWSALKLSEGRFVPGSLFGVSDCDTLPVDHSAAVVVASFKRCERLFVYNVPTQLRNSTMFAEVWARGTPPNLRDLVRVVISSVSCSDGSTAVIFDSQLVETPESGSWTCLSAVVRLEDSAQLFWREEGSDAENWRGNYGTRLSNHSLVLVSTDAAPSAHALRTESALRCLRKLPWHTYFGSGTGMSGVFAVGQQVSSGIWQTPMLQSQLPDQFPLDSCYLDEGSRYTTVSHTGPNFTFRSGLPWRIEPAVRVFAR